MMEPTDESLVREVQEGGISAFETLVKRYQQRLLAFTTPLVRDPHAAADIVQETFIRLYKTIDRVDTTKKFSSYLYVMARNQAFSYLRSRKIHVPLEDIEHIPSGESAEEDALRKEDAASVTEALSSVDAKYRNVIKLYYFQDLSYEEIAKRLHLPVNTIRTHLKRAKEAVKKVLTHEHI